AKNHDKSAGLWLKIAKKATGISTVTYAEALDVALCYGWIDGQKGSFDEQYFLQKFTPRRAKSIWSKINVEKVAGLIASGEMKPSGLKAVEAAKQDGRWAAAYSSPKNMEVPADFQFALEKNKKAKAFFETLTGAKRYSFLFRIETAKKAETREKRIRQFVQMLAKGETF
ncbi:MAG TPA: YdeI/OmpD-associated family protein, partial [Anaerolineales bacterium]|nr:YdeI/OmpD-associated family protein [Anaerolineales bacterium]